MSIPFQAKANELQLLKHWGQAAATKRQTQMKYGFWFFINPLYLKKKYSRMYWCKIRENREKESHLPNKPLSVSSKAWTSVSAFSLVKQSGGLIFMTLRSRPSSLIIMWCFSSILHAYWKGQKKCHRSLIFIITWMYFIVVYCVLGAYSLTMLTQVSPSGSLLALSFTTSNPINRPYPLRKKNWQYNYHR